MQHILRRGSTKVKQAIRMNAKQAVDVYRSIFDKTQSEPGLFYLYKFPIN